MKKVLIFGCGSTGQRIYEEVKDKSDVIGFLDNDASKWDEKKCGIQILGNASCCKELDYDEVLIASLTGYEVIREQLINAGIESSKINSSFVDTQVNARINFLRDYAEMSKDLLDDTLCVAEGGVFQGEFAKLINEYFPKQTIYLFDTFEGFDQRDIKIEKESDFSEYEANHLSITSEEMVLGKLPHKDKAIIRKGYFPETAEGLESKKFVFVNLDFDLYNPILEGLRFFYPKLVDGGCMLVHNYYNPGYKGVKEAIDIFEQENGKLIKFPIGDHCSLGIIKRD